jgi:hypothetical protein
MLKTPSLAAVLLCCGTAQAALIDRGGGLIYDDVLNVTWLQNAGAGGELSWTDAKAWADQLSVFDSVRGLTWSDWRLPDTQPINGVAWNLAPTTDGSSDWGYNIVSPQHELAHLFHVGLQNLSAYASDGSLRPGLAGVDFGLANTGPFVGLVQDIYWSATASPWYPIDHAIGFAMYSGGDLINHGIGTLHRVMAVRDGDVAFVPEPPPWAMVLAGLGAAGWLTRRSQEVSR